MHSWLILNLASTVTRKTISSELCISPLAEFLKFLLVPASNFPRYSCIQSLPLTMFTQHSSLIQEFAEDTFCFTIWIFDILDGISLSIIKESAISAKKTNRSVKLELRLVTPHWLCSTMFFSFIYLEKLHHLIRNSSEAEQRMQPQICLLIFALDKILTFFQSSGTFLNHQSQMFCPFNVKKPLSFIRLQEKIDCITSKITPECHLWNATQQQSNTFLQNSPLYQDTISCPPASSLQIFCVLL